MTLFFQLCFTAFSAAGLVAMLVLFSGDLKSYGSLANLFKNNKESWTFYISAPLVIVALVVIVWFLPPS
jgi:hypothetical protein